MNQNRSCEHQPASKSAIEVLPVIEIDPTHLQSDSQSHCVVCKENFMLKSSAREMPCNHIYHPDCILPWLAIRNSCPVCRHELPQEDLTDANAAPTTIIAALEEEEDSSAGLTIWRLPGGGFAVGRITGGWRRRNRLMPVIYTKVDGRRIGDERLPRRVAWGSRRGGRDRGSRERGGGFAGQIMRLSECFSGSTGSIATSSGSGFRSRPRVIIRLSFNLFNIASSSSRRQIG